MQQVDCFGYRYFNVSTSVATTFLKTLCFVHLFLYILNCAAFLYVPQGCQSGPLLFPKRRRRSGLVLFLKYLTRYLITCISNVLRYETIQECCLFSARKHCMLKVATMLFKIKRWCGFYSALLYVSPLIFSAQNYFTIIVPLVRPNR